MKCVNISTIWNNKKAFGPVRDTVNYQAPLNARFRAKQALQASFKC